MATLKKYKTKHPGIRYYESPERKYKGKPDKYFSIRYMHQGKQYEEGLGWESQGINATYANQILSELKKAHRTGEGPTSLKEKKENNRIKKLNIAKEKERQKKENITFNTVWKQYFPNQKLSVTPRSYMREESLFKIWISPVIGDMSMKNINTINLQKIRHNMEKVGRSARSICYAFDLIRQVFNFANKNKLINCTSPTKNIKKPKKDNKRHRYLSPEEAHLLLSELRKRSPSLYQMALISIHCGLRAGEIFNLKWFDIDFQNNRLILRDTKGGRDRFPLMTNEVKNILNSKTIGNSDDLVFPDRKGNKRKAISKSFLHTVNDLGFNKGISDNKSKVVFHTLRHTFASWLVQKGVSIYEVSKMLGHSTISMSERYAHLAPSNYENSVKVIETITENSKNKTSNIREIKNKI